MPDLGDRPTLKASFDTRINDNSSNAISEADVRDSLKDTVDTLGAEIDAATTDIADLQQDLADELTARSAADNDLTTAIAAKGLVYIGRVDGAGVVDGTPINQLGGTPVWDNPSVGVLTLTITGAFAVDKTSAGLVLVGSSIGSTSGVFFSIEFTSVNVITFNFFDNTIATPADISSAIQVTITVYP